MPVRKLKRKVQPVVEEKTEAQLDAEILTKRRSRNGSKDERLPGPGAVIATRTRGKRGPKPKYDYDAAREIFMTSAQQPTLKQISMRTNIPYGLVRQKAAKERWIALRNREQLEILKEKRQNFQTRMAGEAVIFDETSIDVAKLGQGIIAGRLIEISRLLAASGEATSYIIDKLKRGEPLEKGDLYSVVNYKELVSLAQAAKLFQEIGRIAFGTEVVDGTILRGDDIDPEIEKVVSIGGELAKDDPARLAAFLEALERTGLTHLAMEEADDEDTDQVQIIEAELLPATRPVGDRPELTASITTMGEGSNASDQR